MVAALFGLGASAKAYVVLVFKMVYDLSFFPQVIFPKYKIIGYLLSIMTPGLMCCCLTTISTVLKIIIFCFQ